MALTPTNKIFKNNGRDIKYLNKDFQNFRGNLIEYAKTYFPKTYSDFNESSPGMMFIEMASYIGDVLSYYIDDTLKESLMPYAEDAQSVVALSKYLGYKPKVTSPAITTLSVYQLVPAIGTGVNNKPDATYLLRIKAGMTSISNTDGVQFMTTDVVDFNDATNREQSVYSVDSNTGETVLYLMKKTVSAISAIEKTDTFTFSSYSPYKYIDLRDTDVIGITKIMDSEGNSYYEVPYLAQELVYQDYANTQTNDPDLYQFNQTVPYILKMIKTSRRYVVNVNEDGTTRIQFGYSDETVHDESIIPTLKNVGLGLPNSINKLGESYDPTNFLKTNTYGSSPSNTELTVTYMVGGGINSNVQSGQLKKINSIAFDDDTTRFTPQELALYTNIKESVAIDNEIPATGGRGGESIDEIRENSLAFFGAQNRAVTAADYQIRALSMPTKYGSVSKAFAVSDVVLDTNSPEAVLSNPNYLQEFTNLVMGYINTAKSSNQTQTIQSVKDDINKFVQGKTSNITEQSNPLAINLYVLGYDNNKNLTQLNRAVKENLKTYFGDYRILTDAINIIDGFIINIGVDFEITVYANYNKAQVLTDCVNALKSYFNIDNWNFNQVINLSEIELLLANVDGVSAVTDLSITNKCGTEYNNNSYDIEAATKNKMIYPSLDPSIWEVKYPDSDIKGRIK
jgi:hypothetical protein